MTAPKLLPLALFTGLAVTLLSPATEQAMATPEPDLVVLTPGSALLDTSQTRATGHIEFTKFGLHVYTESNTSTDKAAGYVAVDYPLTDVGSPAIEWLYNEPLFLMKPGLQVVIDKDNDGDIDGILVGEPWAYGDDWWSGSSGLTDSGLSCPSGCGNTNSGTLDEWRTSYPAAKVKAVGFSLGSGAHGNGTLQSMTYGNTRYEFSNVEPTTTPIVTPKTVVSADSPRCNHVRIKMRVRALAAGTTASPGKVKLRIKDRAHWINRATLYPGSGAILRRAVPDDNKLHVYRVYANKLLVLTYKVRNTCD